VNDQDVYPLAIALIKSQPLTFLQGLITSILDYLRPYMMIGYINLDTLQEPIKMVIDVLTWLGLIRMCLHWKNVTWSLGLCLFVGCVSSMSFVPPIDAFIRPLAATITISGLMPGFLFLWIKNRISSPVGINT